MLAKRARQASHKFSHSTVSAKSSAGKRTSTRYGNRTSNPKNAQKLHGTETGTTSRLAFHLVGLRPDMQHTPGAPDPDPADNPPDAADAWADLDIPQFLRRGSR
jgi:hypothetical protein